MELQDELLEWKSTHKNRFSIHSLKDSASKLSSLLGVPSYEEFTEFVDEVYWAGNLGWSELDRYDQVAAALIHLRTGSTWVFSPSCSSPQQRKNQTSVELESEHCLTLRETSTPSM